MLWYAAQRTGQVVITIWIVLTAVFFLSFLSGDPVSAMFPDLNQAQIEDMRAQLGYDRPVYVLYGEYLLGLLRGDLGDSLTYRQPVATIVAGHVGASLQLIAVAIVLSTLIGVATGVLAATWAGRLPDRINTVVMAVLQSVPPFWSGIMLILVFSVLLRLLPTSGFGTPAHVVLPALTLALYSCGVFSRVTRASVLERWGEPHIVAAEARGVRGWELFRRHVGRNALPPVVSSIGYRVAELAGGTVVVETIFGWPGLGSVLLFAVFRRDYPLIQGAVLTIAVFVIAVNLVVDLVIPFLDRRVAARA